jgi:hypothetical protein
MYKENSLFGVWNPTKHTLTGLQALHNALAKEETLLELEIYTLQNEQIDSQYAFDAQTLLKEWQGQQQPFGDLNIAFLRLTPMDTIYLPESRVMPTHSTGHITVTCLGVIDNLSEIRDKLFLYGYEWNIKNVAATLSCLFHSYLESGYILPIEAMRVIMKKLKGHFALMVLVGKGNWLMVGSRNYPLAICKAEPTVYFGTDAETLALFSSSIIPVSGKPKPTIFCATSFQSDLISPIPL